MKPPPTESGGTMRRAVWLWATALGMGCELIDKLDQVEDTGEVVPDSGPSGSADSSDADTAFDPDTGPQDTGPPVDTGVEPVPAFTRAVWSSQVKDFSDPQAGAACREGAWNADHGALTRSALLEGGLDTYVATLGTGDPTDCWWLNLERVLAAIAPDDGLVVAGGVDPGPTYAQLAETIPAMRLLAVEHPELQALVLDDFMGALRRWDKPSRAFGAEELAALRVLATDTTCEEDWCAAPPIALWPYSTARELLYVAVPGLEFGLPACPGSCDRRADHQLHPETASHTGDAIGAHLLWTAEADLPDATLRFLFDDRFAGRAEAIADLVVRRGGVELGRFALNNDQSPGTPGQASAMRSVTLPFAVEQGVGQELELVIEARSEVVPEVEPRLVRVWGVEVWNAEGDVMTDVLAVSELAAVQRRDATRAGLATDLSELAVLESTAASHIVDHVDAVLVHDLEPSARWFDIEVHRHLVGAACRSIRSRGVDCLSTQWGNDQWRVDLDPDVQAERVQVARDSADGVVVYRHPIDLVGGGRDDTGAFVPPDHGIYAEVSPADPAAFDIGATWPRYTRGVPGYTRRWEQAVDCDGTWTVAWAMYGGAGRFDLRVGTTSGGADVAALSVDLGETTASGSTVLDLSTGDRVFVELAGKASVGNATYGIDARLDAPADCDGGGRRTDWSTSSHVDPELADLFEAVHTALQAADPALD